MPVSLTAEKSEAVLRFLGLAQNVIYAEIDESGRITECNNALRGVLGLKEELVGRLVTEVFDGLGHDWAEDLLGHDDRSIPRILRLRHANCVFSCVIRPFQDRHILVGERLWIESSGSILAMTRQVSELASMTRELARKNRELAQANETILRLAREDPLTGLANRRYMEEKLTICVSSAARHSSPLSLVMCDLDLFKSVNDRFGHAAGDLVLRQVGSLLMASCRMEDVAARAGGEEFILLLPHTNACQASQLANRIRKSVQAMDMLDVGVTITASFGVAQLLPGEQAHCLVARADQALYEAKRSGRNQVVVHYAHI